MLTWRLGLLVAALWAGSLWTIGYVVAPTLFLALHDNVLAGTIVGVLLRSQAWLAIACAALLLLLLQVAKGSTPPAQRRSCTLIIVAMLACALVIYLGLQPVMAQLKIDAGTAGLAGTPQGRTFGMLHGVSQLFYLAESGLAGWLLLKLR
ncbi:DUF4149 domain-containing protein [Massilia sp. PWRC2]|uniref:DUF4149 domain-containing protein n=1 Tax=Massilia sp. PWRC2 TaxID=2804626 RepID=UPI003CEC271E